MSKKFDIFQKIFKKSAQAIPGKKVKQVIVPLGVILILGAAPVAYTLFNEKASNGENQEAAIQEESEIQARLLDGRLVSSDKANGLPVAIMIENKIESRPASGLSRAGLVFEAPAEAGITRFLAVFDSRDEVAEIGPIRSARDYYLDWAAEFGALYVHCGGSPQALKTIPSYPIYDLNEFYNALFFWRSAERTAPHNLYSNSELLNKAIEQKEVENKAAFEAWRFKDDFPASIPQATKISIDFSIPQYKAVWVYTSDTNEYLRYHDNEAHEDKDGTSITAKNIAIMVTQASVIDNEGRLNLETLGKGKAWVFRDGGVLEATWQKIDPESRLRFYDVTGREIEFNRGTTWVEVARDSWRVEYN
ncbi:DUF3048 domain-containing protein [Patescibacteria group bacterium]|nr:DUF3048 domain-containing protein [Patescibacteria group bacterium]MBU1921932.1 DUF3048 domain-containing protein [Patescibacteria group bacterium]